MAALADTGDMDAAALGLGLQNDLGRLLIGFGGQALEEGVELGVHRGQEIGHGLLAFRLEHEYFLLESYLGGPHSEPPPVK